MSKIEDALRRIQKQRASDPRPKRRARGKDLQSTVVLENKEVLLIDQAGLQEAGLMGPDKDLGLIADQFREIKRPLIAHAFGKRASQIPDGHLILVTSALAGEGKSFTCINLAMSLAREQDHSVLLVDADVSKSHITDVLGLSESPGLLDVLEDTGLHPESAVIPTNIEGFSILPAGKPRRNATELLASARMDQVATRLGSDRDGRIVLFDSSPLLLTTESKILSGVVGQIVLVVMAESTEQDSVDDAIDALDEEKAVSMILNGARAVRQGQVYSYSGAGSHYQDHATSR